LSAMTEFMKESLYFPGGREGGKEGRREGEREGGREGGKEGRRKGGREGGMSTVVVTGKPISLPLPPSLPSSLPASLPRHLNVMSEGVSPTGGEPLHVRYATGLRPEGGRAGRREGGRKGGRSISDMHNVPARRGGKRGREGGREGTYRAHGSCPCRRPSRHRRVCSQDENKGQDKKRQYAPCSPHRGPEGGREGGRGGRNARTLKKRTAGSHTSTSPSAATISMPKIRLVRAKRPSRTLGRAK